MQPMILLMLQVLQVLSYDGVLFLDPNRGSWGDMKPLRILALRYAQEHPKEKTVLFSKVYELNEIESEKRKVEKWMDNLNLGTINGLKESFKIITHESQFDEEFNHNNYLCVSAHDHQDEHPRCTSTTTISIDFGDMPGKFRSVTKLIQRENKPYTFGSITLPIRGDLAPPEIQAFSEKHRKNGRKIMCIVQRLICGGSMLTPENYAKLVNREDWAYIVIGFNPNDKAYKYSVKHYKNFPQDVPKNVHHAGFVHFEYLMPYCDFVMHCGGAGTTATALIGGVPQFIATDGVLYGDDKTDNRKSIIRLGVSPKDEKQLYDIEGFMSELNTKYQNYKDKALQCQEETNAEKGIENAITFINLNVKGELTNKDVEKMWNIKK